MILIQTVLIILRIETPYVVRSKHFAITSKENSIYYCVLIQKWIDECTDSEEKKKLEHYLECHKHDAEWCPSFMFWMFQKSYAQQGKHHQEWQSLELHREYIE